MKKMLVLLVVAIFASCNTGAKKESTGTSTVEPKKPKIEVVSHSLKKDEFSTTVYAVVKNNTNKKAEYIDVQSFFYDEQGNTVGSGLGNALELEAGASKTIEIFCVDDVSTATQYKVELGNVMW